MMADFVYKPNKAGMGRLMKSGIAKSAVAIGVSKVQGRANSFGAGYFGSRLRQQRVSWHGYIYTGNYQAMKSQAENDVLQRSIG